jgi:Carbohydrate esterase, sialic acid-specific acetylesterase
MAALLLAGVGATSPEAAPRAFDVLIVAGQSNAYYGLGCEPGAVEGAYQPVQGPDGVAVAPVDRLGFLPSRTDAVSFAEGFARGLAAEEPAGSAPLLIMPAAVSGKGISTGDWGPGGVLTQRLAGELAELRADYPDSRVLAFAWQGGETDTGGCCGGRALGTEAYVDAFSAMLRELGIGNEVPVLIGQMPPDWTRQAPERRAIDAALRRIARERPRTAFVSAEAPTQLGLRDEPPGAPDDPLHYGCASQRELGRRYLEAFLALKGAPASP